MTKKKDVAIGYEVGKRPPGLRRDGSFELDPPEVRVSSFIDDKGNTLIVDKKTRLFVCEVQKDATES